MAELTTAQIETVIGCLGCGAAIGWPCVTAHARVPREPHGVRIRRAQEIYGLWT